MDVTDCSDQRFDLGVERFLAGDTLAYNGIVLYQDRSGELVVYSYSEFVHAESSSPAEAHAKIERSKQVLSALCEKSSIIAAIVGARPHKYEFCHDYGNGSFMLAEQKDQGLVWHGVR